MNAKIKWFWPLLLSLPFLINARNAGIPLPLDTIKSPILKNCEHPDSSYAAQLECTWELFSKLLESKLKYPGIALENGEQGTAVIRFKISKNGTLYNPHVIIEFAPGVAYDLDRNLQKAVRKLDLDWSFNDTLKAFEYSVPVVFSIPKEKPSFKGFESIFCEDSEHFTQLRVGRKQFIKYLDEYNSSMDSLWCSQLFDRSFQNVELTYFFPTGSKITIACEGEIIDELRHLIPAIEKKSILQIKYTRIFDSSKKSMTKTIAIN